MTISSHPKGSMKEKHNLDRASAFGQTLWQELVSRPFGTPNKRELEVMILQAAADARLIDETKPAATATLLSLSLARTHSYLSDLAQRRPALQDKDALILLGQQLARVEVLPTDKHLSIPLQRADLRIWLERRLAADGLHPGETLRRDVVKLTPVSLLRLLDNTNTARKPAVVLKKLSQLLEQPEWIDKAKQEWTTTTNWIDTLNTFNTIASLSEAFAKLLPVICAL